MSVAFIILLLIVGAFMLLRKYAKLPSFLSNLSISKPQDTIHKLELRTKLEQEKANELRAVLKAKDDLARAKAINTALRREISSISENSVAVNRKDILEEPKYEKG